MGKLDGLRCYLAGPIDNAADKGVGWRKHITPNIEYFGVTVIDPTLKKHDDDLTEQEMGERFRNLLKTDPVEASKVARKIRCHDLRYVDISDFLIVYLDPGILTCGTWEELFNANRQKKPIFIVWEGPEDKIPLWLYGTLSFDYFYFSFFDLIDDLHRYDSGEKIMDERWVLLKENF